MKFFDSKYRLFGVVNVIDLIVVVALLAGGYALYRVLSPKTASPTAAAATGTAFTYQIWCPTLRNVSTSQIKVGDTIYKNNGKPIGKITSVTSSPTAGEAWDNTSQKIVTYSSPVNTDIFINVAGKGEPLANGVAVGDLLLHSGQPMPVMTSTFECDTSYIVNLKIDGK